MDTLLFEHFMVLTETLSITKAAEKLDKAESVLSRQMARLENELGVQLFTRTHSGLALTPAGIIIRDCLCDMNDHFRMALEKAVAIQEEIAGVINIGVINNHLLSENAQSLFAEFRKMHPDVTVSFFSYPLEDLVRFLNEKKLDFVYGSPIDFSDNMELFFIKNEIANNYLLTCKNYPLHSKDGSPFTLEDFKDETFLVLGGHPVIIKTSSALGEELGFSMKFRAMKDQIALLTQVQLGAGVSFIDTTSLFYGNKMFDTIPISGLPALELGLIGRKNGNGYANTLLIEYMKKNQVQ